MLFLLFFVGSAFAGECEPGWTLFSNNCYKHIYNVNNRVTYAEAQAQCVARNSYVTTVASPEERDFVQQLGLRPGDWNSETDSMIAYQPLPALRIGSTTGSVNWVDFLLVGATRDPTTKQFKWNNSTSTWFNWCQRSYYPVPEPTNNPGEDCTMVQLDAPCLYDTNCHGDFGTFLPNKKYSHYMCKKPVPDCKEGAEVRADGKCGCKKEYFDITDTDCPERRDYKKGEVCIPRIPCQNITSKESLSIIFVVDSSQSIGASNWKNMVKFLKSGSRQLDNSIDVGFVQFSTDVTYSDWLPRKWTKDDYLDQTPSNFDAGYTNTPAALNEAGTMFTKDRSTHQVAVLITDGMPFVEDVLPKEEAMPKTIDAVKKLRKAGIELVALGYGKELRKYQSYLKKILANPRQDYFEYDKEAGDLKDIHMTVLLNKVCARFQ